MTTNVFDSVAGVVATDSRWSQQQGRWLVYVDDVQFDKIEIYADTAFVFAGKGHVIQIWKNWLATSPQDLTMRPGHDGISICVIHAATKQVLFKERQDIIREGGYFAGSGSRFAFTCWNVNRDAKKSVESAKNVDPASGGEVKFFELASRANNLRQFPTGNVTLAMVDEAIFKRGMVMDIASIARGAIPFKLMDTAGSQEDADLASLREKISKGEISAEAPCDGMHSEWSQKQKDELDVVLKKVFGMK